MRNRTLLVVVGVIVVAVAAFLVVSSGTAPANDVIQNISPAAYQDQFTTAQTTHMLIDVRTPEEFASGHIHGAVNIPVDSLDSHLSEIPSDQPIVVYCRSGNRSASASQILAQAGYSQIYDLGGVIDWTAQGFPVE